jgi:hypothetical protein
MHGEYTRDETCHEHTHTHTHVYLYKVLTSARLPDPEVDPLDIPFCHAQAARACLRVPRGASGRERAARALMFHNTIFRLPRGATLCVIHRDQIGENRRIVACASGHCGANALDVDGSGDPRAVVVLRIEHGHAVTGVVVCVCVCMCSVCI